MFFTTYLAEVQVKSVHISGLPKYCRMILRIINAQTEADK